MENKTPAAKFETREAWLQAAALLLAPLVRAACRLEVPAIHVSVGFPKGARGKSAAIGQCWRGECSADGTPHVFVCPTLGALVGRGRETAGRKVTDPGAPGVLDVLLHELIHATVGCDEGHKGEFARVAKVVGLVRPWTATTPSGGLAPKLAAIAVELGAYPHAVLTVARKPKVQGRMRLFECPCGQKVRWGNKHVDLRATCTECAEPFTAQ